MRLCLVFYKENNNWYADLAEDHNFTKEDLQMVDGSDLLCDIIAQGEDRIFVEMDTSPRFDAMIDFRTLLSKIKEDEFGATYKASAIQQVEYPDLEIWLCPVTKHVFGEYPELIYLNY